MSLRELMVEEIKRNGWLDYEYENRKGQTDVAAYTKWLAALSDEDFLAAYNRVRDAESKLD
jgi:hypothetical protein